MVTPPWSDSVLSRAARKPASSWSRPTKVPFEAGHGMLPPLCCEEVLVYASRRAHHCTETRGGCLPRAATNGIQPFGTDLLLGWNARGLPPDELDTIVTLRPDR